MFTESSAIPLQPSSTAPHDRNVRIPRGLFNQYGSFRDLVMLAYPGPKPEVALAVLTGKSARQCRRWLNDESDPPASVFALVLAEFLWRLGQRRKR